MHVIVEQFSRATCINDVVVEQDDSLKFKKR